MSNIPFIALFTYGNTYPQVVDCIVTEIAKRVGMQKKCYYSGRYGDADIARARARMLDDFIKTKSNVVLCIDRDIIWDPNGKTLDDIIDSACENQAIVAAAQPLKTMDGGIGSHLLEDINVNEEESFDKLFAAKYVNTGMMAIPRKIVEEVIEKAGRNRNGFSNSWLQYIDENGIYLSEDWAFCRRAEDLGYKCFVKLYKDIKHIGDYAYTIYNAANKKTQNNIFGTIEKKTIISELDKIGKEE